MSISSLAQEEVVRTDRTALYPQLRPIVARHLTAIAAQANLTPQQTTLLGDDLLPLAAEPPTQKTPGSTALDALVRYIPTETITLYVAAMAAIKALSDTFGLTVVQLYWGFVVATPVLFLLIYMGKRKTQKLSLLPADPVLWPWWKLIAATIAFAVWALAVPSSPYLTGDSGKVVAGFLALLISTALSLIEPIVEPAPATE